MSETGKQNNRAKSWEILCFATKNMIPNVFMFLMNYAAYIATGSYGIMAATAGIIITASRLFDGVTDPIVGFIVDKTDGKFGKFRPIMILGYLIIALALYLMYFVALGSGIVAFILIYALYILGYTCVTTASNGAQAVLTKDPMQRAHYGRMQGIFGVLLSTGYSAVYSAGYLYPKYGSINLQALQEMCITAIVIGGIFTVVACIGIASKDKPEYYSGLPDAPKVSMKDIFYTLKGNRPLRMLILASSSDKLALQTAGQSAVGIMIWGIVVGNYTFRSHLSLYTFIPTILMIFLGVGAAGKKLGYKKATIYSAWCSIITMAVQFLVLLIAPKQIGSNVFVTALFLIAFTLCSGFKQVSTSCVPPMTADVADYEMYRTGKFVPGTVASVFTFMEKLISSLAGTIVAFSVSLIGYVDTMPQPNDPYSTPVFWVAVALFCGLPIVGWICSIAAMRFYDLTPEKMNEIQQTNSERKAAMAKQ